MRGGGGGGGRGWTWGGGGVTQTKIDIYHKYINNSKRAQCIDLSIVWQHCELGQVCVDL